jgi:putative proteasome-type protease
VELGDGAPFVVIGNSGHGKAILNRTLTDSSSMHLALKTGFLSFDSTRASANDVDFPIDVVLYNSSSFSMIEHRYQREDLEKISAQWAQELRVALNNIPNDWMDAAFRKKPVPNNL